MAADARLRALIEQLLKQHEPAIRRAFLQAMADARSSIVLRDVVDALARGDLGAAMRALEISRAFLAPLDQAIQAAYFDGGRGFTRLLTEDGRRNGVTVIVRFDPGNFRAASWLRQHSSTLIVEIVDDQREAVREALAVGMEAGRHPRTVALDIVGRIDRTTKRRAGGIVGLTSGQARAVENARRQLRSGDPSEMEGYFDRKLRDRRFDRVVRRAIREGRAVAAPDVQRITGRYSDRLLKHRGDVIARTESLTALSYSQDESARQLLEASDLRPDQIVRTWIARLDGRTRDSHVLLNEDKAPLDGFFISPATGARMRFPRDTSGGASGEDVIQCRCTSSLKVDWKGARGANGL